MSASIHPDDDWKSYAVTITIETRVDARCLHEAQELAADLVQTIQKSSRASANHTVERSAIEDAPEVTLTLACDLGQLTLDADRSGPWMRILGDAAPDMGWWTDGRTALRLAVGTAPPKWWQTTARKSLTEARLRSIYEGKAVAALDRIETFGPRDRAYYHGPDGTYLSRPLPPGSRALLCRHGMGRLEVVCPADPSGPVLGRDAGGEVVALVMSN